MNHIYIPALTFSTASVFWLSLILLNSEKWNVGEKCVSSSPFKFLISL